MNAQPQKRGAPSLDVLIREAEMTVVDGDLQWRDRVQALGPALRQSAVTATWMGLVVLGAVGAGWLIVRRLRGGSSRRVEVPSRRSPPRHVSAPPSRATGWRRVSELGGALVGSALRSGLVPAGGKNGLPFLISAGLPWLTRWWRARTTPQPPPRADFTKSVPGNARARTDRSARRT